MVNKKIILEKIDFLEENLKELYKYKKLSLIELKNNKTFSWAVRYGLQSSIEAILDIGNHIISDETLGHPDSYEEIIELLGQKGVITKALAEKFKGMARFRNLLIHEYAKIDPRKVYENLQKAPEQFKAFIKGILAYIS